MKILIAVILASIATGAIASGKHLYLKRGTSPQHTLVSHRAVFDHPGDCELIAKYANEKEPLVHWFCAGPDKKR